MSSPAARVERATSAGGSMMVKTPLCRHQQACPTCPAAVSLSRAHVRAHLEQQLCCFAPLDFKAMHMPGPAQPDAGQCQSAPAAQELCAMCYAAIATCSQPPAVACQGQEACPIQQPNVPPLPPPAGRKRLTPRSCAGATTMAGGAALGAGAAPSGVAPACGDATARTCTSASSGGTGSAPAAGGASFTIVRCPCCR